MPNSMAAQLKEPYRSHLRDGAWEEYLGALSRDCLRWFFGTEISCLIQHLVPLNSMPPGLSIPPRLCFAQALIEPNVALEVIDQFHRDFVAQGDMEAAAAAAGAALGHIIDSGLDFSRLAARIRRVDDLLESSRDLSALAKASMLHFKGLSIYSGPEGDFALARDTLKAALHWAEEADALSLRIMASSSLIIALVNLCEFAQAELSIFETLPLVDHPDVAFTSVAMFRIAQAAAVYTLNKIPEASNLLADLISHPLYSCLPPTVWLLGQGMYLFNASLCGDLDAVEQAARRMQELVVLEGNNYFNAFLHLGMGVRWLTADQPQKALAHMQETHRRSRQAHSRHAELTGLTGMAQALNRLRREQEVLDLLEPHVYQWLASGLPFQAYGGVVELVTAQVSLGRFDEARANFLRVDDVVRGNNVGFIARPVSHWEDLRGRLFPDEARVSIEQRKAQAPILIETFGDLKVRVGDHTTYDRRWRGGRTKALLKALIVLGGVNVSAERLMDILWPDSEGDKAAQNLKTAMHRLRKIAGGDGKQPPAWITVREGKVSLSPSLCFVDALGFRQTLGQKPAEALTLEQMTQALDLHGDDFLAADDAQPWIGQHRRELRELYIKSAQALAERCLADENPRLALPYQERAVRMDGCREGLYALLMRLYLSQGDGAQALAAYHQARRRMAEELGAIPSPALTALARQAEALAGKG